MTNEESVLAVIDALERECVPYMIVGSMSSNLYGVPRSTKDADFVFDIRSEQLKAVVAHLPASIRPLGQLAFETITGTTKIELRLAESEFRIELFWLSDDPHDRERFARRRSTNIFGRATFAPTAEDVIVQKLRWSKHGKRSKDVDDARNVIAVQAGNLDWDYIHRWCDVHGTRALLDEIRRSIPEL